MAYYDGVVIAGGYPGTELLAVRSLEVFAGCDEDVGAGVEAEEFICPLERQMVGDDEHALLAEPEALALHGGGSHLEGLAGPDLVGEQGVAAVEHVCNRAELVGAEGNVRVHASERDVGAVVFPGTVGVEELVIAGHK